MGILSRISGVYLIKNKANGKVYVGSSHNVWRRILQHKTMLRKQAHHSLHLQRAWDMYGQEGFSFEIIEEVEVGHLMNREQYWIDYYKAWDGRYGYNVALSTTAPMFGRKHSPETIRKFTNRKGKDNSNYKDGLNGAKSAICSGCGIEFVGFLSGGQERRYCTQECYHKNKTIAPETRFKYGTAMRGKKRTAESLAKFFAKRAKFFIITDPDGTEYFIQGLAAFCRANGLDQGSMSAVINGRQSAHKGWVARYATDNELELNL